MATSKGFPNSSFGGGINLYLTLSRFLNLRITAARNLGHVKDAFLAYPTQKRPYIIGLTGSVAAGKSAFARLLRTLLARWPDHPRVEILSSDGFCIRTAFSRNIA